MHAHKNASHHTRTCTLTQKVYKMILYKIIESQITRTKCGIILKF